MPEPDDHQLLAQFARGGSQTAFATLVARYVSLVHSTAFRCTRNTQHAEDITQAVFIILARKAGGLSPRVVLSGWLYQTARLAAANVLKSEYRRQRREHEVFMQSTPDDTNSLAWEKIAPFLDEAMGCLGETDRTAVVLRYFENRNTAEIATALRMNDETARKRVHRALEKLRTFFAKRGIVLSSVLIAGAVSANSVSAAPAALSTTVTGIAVAKGAAAGGSTLTLVKGVLKIMAWTHAKTAVVIGACVLLAAGTTTVTLYHVNRPVQGIPKDWAPLRGDPDQWRWADGKIIGHDTNGDSLLASSRDYADVTLSATLSTTNREASLALRLQDADNGYLVVFAPGGTSRDDAGHVGLLKRVAGNESALASYNGQVFSYLGFSAKVTVIARGPILEVHLNGNRIIRVMDSTFSSGLVGLRMYGSDDSPCDATYADLTIH